MVSRPYGWGLDGTSDGPSAPAANAWWTRYSFGGGREIRGPHAFDLGASEPDLPTEEELLLTDMMFTPTSWEMGAVPDDELPGMSASEHPDEPTEAQMEERAILAIVRDRTAAREKRRAVVLESGQSTVPGLTHPATNEYASQNSEKETRSKPNTEHTDSHDEHQKPDYRGLLGPAHGLQEAPQPSARRHTEGTCKRRMSSVVECEQSEEIGGIVNHHVFGVDD
jgi:hypothetical protein